MAESVQRKKFSIFHNELLDFLLLDGKPGNQRRAAMHFGVTEATISVIVNSDIFKAQLRERQDAKHEAVVMTIQDKMIAAADIGLERLTEKLLVEQDTKNLIDATDKVLNRLGYGPKAPAVAPPIGEQNNYFIVQKDDLAEARARIINGKGGQHALPDHSAPIVGEVQSLPSNLCERDQSDRGSEAGEEVRRTGAPIS